ncbi:DUF2267 domain-containing protein [Mesonia aquimarina]|uniref:DUF2267 domain-containing protein n=1 Tax=Mesonia aquimarina TaxID=1504967 RepID=UPI000EF59816|nr:DUF2267 domain-containing protein [Mesonia aquimarina]
MKDTSLTFHPYTEPAQDYLQEVCEQLGHPQEQKRVMRIWRSVMHTFRDRFPLEGAFLIISPLPVIFRGIYTEDWDIHKHPALTYTSIKEMKTQVKELQAEYGEEAFSWNIATEKIIAITFFSLQKFMKEEHLDHLLTLLPNEIKEYLESERNSNQ